MRGSFRIFTITLLPLPGGFFYFAPGAGFTPFSLSSLAVRLFSGAPESDASVLDVVFEQPVIPIDPARMLKQTTRHMAAEAR